VAKGCQKTIHRYLDTKDARSIGNLWKHMKSCWGNQVVEASDQTKEAVEALELVVKPLSKDGSITVLFKRVRKGKVSYSH